MAYRNTIVHSVNIAQQACILPLDLQYSKNKKTVSGKEIKSIVNDNLDDKKEYQNSLLDKIRNEIKNEIKMI